MIADLAAARGMVPGGAVNHATFWGRPANSGLACTCKPWGDRGLEHAGADRILLAVHAFYPKSFRREAWVCREAEVRECEFRESGVCHFIGRSYILMSHEYGSFAVGVGVRLERSNSIFIPRGLLLDSIQTTRHRCSLMYCFHQESVRCWVVPLPICH